MKLDALRQAVGAGLDELDRGEAVPGDNVFDEILSALRRDEAAEEPEVEAAWRDEVRRRLEVYRAGEKATVSREAVRR